MSNPTNAPAVPPRLRYRGRHGALRREVLAALERELDGGRRRRTPGPLIASTAATLALYAASVSGLLSGIALAGCVALCQPLYLITALGVAHDASHGAFSRRRWVNRAAVFVFDVLGVNGTVWHHDHVVAHHRAPNVSGHDANLYVWGPLRLDPHTPRRAWHRAQHLYAPLLYALASLFKVYVEDFAAFARSGPLGALPGRGRAVEVLRLIGFKLWAVAFSVVVPLLVAGDEAGAVVVGYLVGHVLAGTLMGTVFQPTHTNEHVSWSRPDADGVLDASFEQTVLSSAVDFCVDDPFVTWIAGGLNIHAVHHLFPRLPQTQLPLAARLLAEIAPRHGLTYRTFPSWGAALRSHYRMLRELGRAEETTCQAPRCGRDAGTFFVFRHPQPRE